MGNDNGEGILSSKVYQKLLEVLGDDYQYATQVVTYSEVQGGGFDYVGMAEFRDALTHVKRAINANDESVAFEELNSISEHIRRAAVESMQEYVENKYISIKRRLDLNLHKIKHVKELEQNIKQNIYQGREAKPSKQWKEAIGYFKQAETLLDQLDDELPLINVRAYQVKHGIYLFIAAISGYLIASI